MGNFLISSQGESNYTGVLFAEESVRIAPNFGLFDTLAAKYGRRCFFSIAPFPLSLRPERGSRKFRPV